MKKENKKLHCNQCGKSIAMQQDIPLEGILRIEWEWDYFSDKDGETHTICLCEDCYDRICRSFVLPVSVQEQ